MIKDKNMLLMKMYYLCKRILPRWFQILIRRMMIRRRLYKYKDIWPILNSTAKKPECFSGWPENYRFAFILRHDVETTKGLEKCYHLANLEKEMGFRSSFNFVPEKYKIEDEIRSYLLKHGFEVGIHGLKHDGILLLSRNVFEKRVDKINQYLKLWNSEGFYSPSAHHNLDWFHKLNIEYDSSTFDTDPFEPQPDSIQTIYPFRVWNNTLQKGYIEIPYTIPQDFTVFILMKKLDLRIWKTKLDWIAEKGGMAFLNTHPDYMNFGESKIKIDEYPVSLYLEFLDYVKTNYRNRYWHTLPKQVSQYWKNITGDKKNNF